MDRSHRASEPHVSLLTFASHTWCWACLCVCVPFHALFSPSLCEAAPSVSKFICHTSSGLVWSRERLHTLFMSLTAETRLEVCVCLWVCFRLFTDSMYLIVFCSSLILFLHVRVYTLAYMFVLHTRVKKCACIRNICTWLCVCIRKRVSICVFTQRQHVSDIFILTWYVYACVCLHFPWHVWICVYLCPPMRT